MDRPAPDPPQGDDRELASVDALLSQVLRWGVLVSAAIILLGVALFVVQGGVPAILFAPRGAPASWNADPQSLGVVLAGLASARPAAVTDLGLLLLMITPVVSVGIAVAAFAARRDWLYVAIAGFVFAMLMLGFAIGSA